MKKLLFFFSGFLISVFFSAQTLDPTSSISSAGAADTFKGGYTFAYTTTGTPWNGSLISYGGYANKYDTQISSSYNGGGHISFRTRNGDGGTGYWNPWYEIWHSGNLNTPTSDFTTRNIMVNGAVNIKANGTIPVISGNGGFTPTGLKFIDESYTVSGQIKEWAILKGNGWNKGLNFVRYDAVNACAGGICDTPLTLFDDGNINIGLAQKQINIPSKVAINDNMKVNAKFEAKEVKVTSSPTADFVFEENYDLPKLEIVEQFIKENKHLPEIASAKAMEQEGVNVGEFQIKLLQKIEELTLYTIEQNKQLQEQSERIEKLEQQLLNKK